MDAGLAAAYQRLEGVVMTLLPFHAAEPEVARRELISLTVLDERTGLPPDTYVFLEHYCPLPGCDCRRVVLRVSSPGTRRDLATVHHYLDAQSDPSKPQTSLAQGQPQTELSPALLELFTRDVREPRHRERLEAHYQAFKTAVKNPAHPIQGMIPADARKVRAPVRTAPRVNRNDPCPCGSGKKYKKCHGASEREV